MWPLWKVLKLETMTQFIHFSWKPKISKQNSQLLLLKCVQIVQMFVVFCGDKSKRLILTSQVTDNSLKS